ncbi:hypothetical protein BCR37DRAFT_393970 [Protomyces lactucae-debilis]|uniref:F-box domain-containing protein n=1 Tax=Protomyces lactucae-debilis TaxID=2754530 RepID=A0A1Y2F7L2_PROLT|nr:uncharacterized protein BCR37DRAFT_393970 [Protomyces lactucae-debilis]ORY79892.1 hypothetical protein BCR37DRAFT_393970 [Protomyces lactucae-debilis]
MDALPAEICQEILSYVPITELHAKTRHVSRFFYQQIDLFLSSHACLRYLHAHWGILWTPGVQIETAPAPTHLPACQAGQMVMGAAQYRAFPSPHWVSAFTGLPSPCKTIDEGYFSANSTPVPVSDLWGCSDDEEEEQPPPTPNKPGNIYMTSRDPLCVNVCFDKDALLPRSMLDKTAEPGLYTRNMHLHFSWSVKTCLSVRATLDVDGQRYWADSFW